MWILKIGGSWITSNHLNELIDLLKKKTSTDNLILVVGAAVLLIQLGGLLKKCP